MMGRKKKPVLRLTLFFITVVIASGSILAYLSINNISNLKELTEKKVLEQQKNLAVAVSDQIEERIVYLADRFSNYSNGKNINQAGAMMPPDTLDLIGDAFVVDRKGKFFWPWFIDGFENPIKRVPSLRFHTNFDQAERAEYIDKDFGKANSKYLASLRVSTDNLDSVQTMNALARLSVKMEDGPQALSYYSSIISKYHGICDPHGFPYIYYAIPQLIKISNPSNRNRVFQEIVFCLTGMESGKIPLNHSTHEMLKLVSEWIVMELTPHESITPVKESIQTIENLLSFIERNREVIREYLLGDNKDEIPIVRDSYHALSGTMQDGGELILINHTREYVSGFSVVFGQLWGKISEQNLTEGTEVEFEIEMVGIGNGIDRPEHPLTTSLEISPYFPGYHVIVKLKNESLIEEFVRRRSWIYGIALTLLLGGMILGILLILRDISREEHLSHLRADFISNVTHELKTPLTSIQLFTESIALNRIKSAAQKNEYLHIILKETESLKRMINNILDFSKEGKGKRNYNFKEVDVTALVNAAIEDLEYWLIEKKFTLVKEIDPNISAKVDPVALKQAIINLLNNAIKFSKNRREIFVKLKQEEEMILIQVEDKGIGIPDDQKELIFQPFYRIEQKNSEEISGTGLGLSVVNDVVKAHHGKIQVDSQPNEGSTFTILFKSTQENSG